MQKLLLILCFTISACAMADAEPAQVGRFQMVTTGGDFPQYYLLDTTTGQVWEGKKGWAHCLKEWQPCIVEPIAPLPE